MCMDAILILHNPDLGDEWKILSSLSSSLPQAEQAGWTSGCQGENGFNSDRINTPRVPGSPGDLHTQPRQGDISLDGVACTQHFLELEQNMRCGPASLIT